jgi:hypothetical protein
MTPAADYMYSSAEIAAAVKAQMDALMLDAEDPKGPGNLLKAFERVELFDVQDLTDAFRIALISEQRVCVIVVLAQQFTPQIEEQKIVISRLQPIGLIISDRLLGDRVKALFGDPLDATVPGSFALAQLAMTALTGKLLPSDLGTGKTKVISTPANVDSIFLKDEDKQELPGRSAVMLEINCIGGTVEARIGPGSSL